MQKKKFLISIVIPCKNSELNLSKTLSFLHEQKTFFQVIFVYSKSKDNTLRILKKFDSKFIDKKIIKKNCGISEALNIGIKASSGDFIMWIGSDDIIVNNFIKKIKNILVNKRNEKWIITKTKVLSKNKFLRNIIENYKFYKLKNLKFIDLLTENPISAPGVIFSKKFFISIGGFNKKFKFNSDYDMWLRMYKRKRPLILNILSTYYNRHPNSLSSRYFVKQFIEQFNVSNKYYEKNLLIKVSHLFKIFVIIIVYKIFNY